MTSLEVTIEILGVSEPLKGVAMKEDKKALGKPSLDWNWGHLQNS